MRAFDVGLIANRPAGSVAQLPPVKFGPAVGGRWSLCCTIGSCSVHRKVLTGHRVTGHRFSHTIKFVNRLGLGTGPDYPKLRLLHAMWNWQYQ